MESASACILAAMDIWSEEEGSQNPMVAVMEVGWETKESA
jgi:hypothetical protein